MQFVHKLVSTFGIGLEQSGLTNSNSGGPISHEALAKRAQAAAQDPAFQRLKTQFATDFDFRYAVVLIDCFFAFALQQTLTVLFVCLYLFICISLFVVFVCLVCTCFSFHNCSFGGGWVV